MFKPNYNGMSMEHANYVAKLSEILNGSVARDPRYHTYEYLHRLLLEGIAPKSLQFSVTPHDRVLLEDSLIAFLHTLKGDESIARTFEAALESYKLSFGNLKRFLTAPNESLCVDEGLKLLTAVSNLYSSPKAANRKAVEELLPNIQITGRKNTKAYKECKAELENLTTTFLAAQEYYCECFVKKSKANGITVEEIGKLASEYHKLVAFNACDPDRRSRAIDVLQRIEHVYYNKDRLTVSPSQEISDILHNTPMTVRLNMVTYTLNNYRALMSDEFRKATELLIGSQTISYFLNGGRFASPKEYYQNLIIAHTLGWTDGLKEDITSTYIEQCMQRHESYEACNFDRSTLLVFAKTVRKYLVNYSSGNLEGGAIEIDAYITDNKDNLSSSDVRDFKELKTHAVKTSLEGLPDTGHREGDSGTIMSDSLSHTENFDPSLRS